MLKDCFNCRNKYNCEVKSQCIHITPEGLDLWQPTTELFEQLEKKIAKLERTIEHLKRRIKEEKEISDEVIGNLIEENEKLMEKK
jgi:predicted ribosome quality control (RQC) complex YloA/Tae2 family protein